MLLFPVHFTSVLPGDRSASSVIPDSSPFGSFQPGEDQDSERMSRTSMVEKEERQKKEREKGHQ